MKTIKKSLLLFAMIFVSGAVFASGDMSVNLIPVKNDKALVEINGSMQNKFEIVIENENGDMVFYKKSKLPSDNYTKVYNFSDLEDGTYRFIVKNNNEEIEKTIDMENGKISVISKEKDMKPFFSFNNKSLKLSYLNFDQKDVHLYLYNSDTDQTLYQANLGSDFSITTALDLSKLKDGSYEAVLASEDHVHPFDIDIE